MRRLKNKKSTATIMALSDALSPVYSSIYQHLDERAARSILYGHNRLICAAWIWAQTTEDANGEPKVFDIKRELADVIDHSYEPALSSGHLVRTKGRG